MTVPRTTVTTTDEVNLAPGFAGLVLAMGLTGMGLYVGVPVFPFGGVAIAGCIFGAVQMVKSKRVAPGFASVVIALVSMVGGLVLKGQLPS